MGGRGGGPPTPPSRLEHPPGQIFSKNLKNTNIIF